MYRALLRSSAKIHDVPAHILVRHFPDADGFHATSTRGSTREFLRGQMQQPVSGGIDDMSERHNAAFNALRVFGGLDDAELRSLTALPALLRQWEEVAERPDGRGGPHIEDGAVVIAQAHSGKLNIRDEIYEMLDEYSAVVKERLLGVDETDNTARVSVLNECFFNELGFKPNRKDYFNVENSMLEKVLSSKLGIPISMCIVYIAIARRANIKVYPINFPSQMLCAYERDDAVSAHGVSSVSETPDRYNYIDVFEGGKILTRNELHRHPVIVGLRGRQAMLTQDTLTPAPMKQIWIRMIRNILHVHVHTQDVLAVRFWLEQMRVLDSSAGEWAEALCFDSNGKLKKNTMQY